MKKQMKLIIEYLLIVALVIACAMLAINLLKQVKECNELETFLEDSNQKTIHNSTDIEVKNIQNDISQ